MIVKTAWPALIPAIERAGHEAILVTEAELLAQHGKRCIQVMPCDCKDVVGSPYAKPLPSCSRRS